VNSNGGGGADDVIGVRAGVPLSGRTVSVTRCQSTWPSGAGGLARITQPFDCPHRQ